MLIYGYSPFEAVYGQPIEMDNADIARQTIAAMDQNFGIALPQATSRVVDAVNKDRIANRIAAYEQEFTDLYFEAWKNAEFDAANYDPKYVFHYSAEQREILKISLLTDEQILAEEQKRTDAYHIEHKDAIECIKHYANPKSLIYCDPPYVLGTRVVPGTYKHECTDEQHERLVETLLTVPGHKILSGYQSPLYKPLLDAGWTLHKKRFVCYTSPDKKDRMECLYCSPVKTTTDTTKMAVQEGSELFGEMVNLSY